ncbi:MAG: SpoIID/LytB domain-containing protein [Thermotogae bacterium]|nr:SpoIID/LytB domain-containing protein [Thermotogota bacterium]
MNIPRAVFTTSFLLFWVFSSCITLRRRSPRTYQRSEVVDSLTVKRFIVKEIFREEPYIKVFIANRRKIELEGKGHCILLSGDSVILENAPKRLRFRLLKRTKGKVLHWVGLGVFRNRVEAETFRGNDGSLVIKRLGIYPRYYLLKGPFKTFKQAIRYRHPLKKAVYSILEVPSKGEVEVLPLGIRLKTPVIYRCDTILFSTSKKKRKYLGEMWMVPYDGREKKLTLINRLKVEEYLRGVVPWEMSPSYPVEALKAQAIAARTHALDVAGIKWALLDKPYDITSDFTTQVYRGLSGYPIIDSVVKATEGIVLMDGDRFSIATFFTSCGGSLESGKSWGDTLIRAKRDDLRGDSLAFSLKDLQKDEDDNVACSPHEDLSRILRYGASVFRWERKVSLKEVERNLKRHMGRSTGKIKEVKVLGRTESGRVSKLLIRGRRGRIVIVGDWNIRQVLGLKSSLFTLRRRGNYLYIRGGGWGHGIGMCQVGAGVRALRGWKYEDILTFYYGNVEFVRLWR